MASQVPPVKNAEFTLDFSLFKNDGTVIANPGTYTKKISIDGGLIADITASVTEEDITYGQLSVVLSAAEMNGDRIWIRIQDDTSGCVPFVVTIYTSGQTADSLKAACLTATGFATPTNITAASGVALSATGADLILKTSPFSVAIANAVSDLATYGLAALNTLLVTTGIKAASVPATVATATNVTDAVTALEVYGDAHWAEQGGLTVTAIRQEMDANSTKLADILTDTGTTLPAQIAAIPSAAGAGATSWTYTLTDSGTGVGIDGADVWVTSDSSGVNILASGMTNSSGQVTFMLDTGVTVFVWRKRAGYNFSPQPDQETVS
jgi:hypothetical protein